MRCLASLCIALSLTTQVEGKRVGITAHDLEVADEGLDFDANTRDALDDFLDGVSAPTGPANPPANAPVGNPILTGGTPEQNVAAVGQEKILRLEEVAERESEDYEEMKIEEICVEISHAREESSYEAEQKEVKAEKKQLSKGGDTEPYHKCDPVWNTHRSIWPTMFRSLQERFKNPGVTDRSAKRPMFMERLGEFVIQEVRHNEPADKESHVLLVFRGCTSCLNEITSTVDWGGLAPVREDGEHHGMSLTDMGGENIVKVRKSYDCLKSRNACKNDANYHDWVDPSSFGGTYVGKSGTPMSETAKTKKIQRATYMFSSYKGDSIIEPLLEEARTGTGAERKEKLTIIGKELRHEEKHIPFNHELEQVHVDLFICSESGSGLSCAPSHESLVIHDGAVLGGSTGTSMLDQLGDRDICTTGTCSTGSFMTECTPGACTSPAIFNRYNQQSDLCYATETEGASGSINKSGRPGPALPFSCIKERFSGQDTPIISGNAHTQGLFFRTGTNSKAHITGHMQWHVTVPTPGTCVPELGDSLYIGMGVAEADPCIGTDGPDLDLGVIFYHCKGAGEHGMKVQNPSTCDVLNYRTFGTWYKNNAISQWAQYSGDAQDAGAGGDDEWFFIRLDAMRQLGVTHIAITTHVYGCTGNPNAALSFSQLEGAFMRFAAGPTDVENFQGVETFAYLDVDVSMAKTAYKGAVMAVLFLEESRYHKLPASHSEMIERGRTDEAATQGMRWQVGFLTDPIRSSNAYNLKAGGVLNQVGAQVFGNTEISDDQRLDAGDALTKMHAGQVSGAGNVLQSLATQQTAEFEAEPHTDSREAGAAVQMQQEHFYQHYSYTFEAGHPGTALYCFAQ